MKVEVVDAIIVLALLLGAVVGFKQGGIKRTVHLVGLILVIMLSFLFKDALAALLYKHLPFFTFGSLLSSIPILNVLFYEIISFIIIFLILNAVLKILLIVSGVIEKVLKATIILSIPSKILGIFVGALEAYLYLYIILFFFTQPVFNIDIINNSKYKDTILSKTPLISNVANNTIVVYKEMDKIINSDKDTTTKNNEAVQLMLDNKMMSYKNANYLAENGKIKISSNEVLNKYKGDK